MRATPEPPAGACRARPGAPRVARYLDPEETNSAMAVRLPQGRAVSVGLASMVAAKQVKKIEGVDL